MAFTLKWEDLVKYFIHGLAFSLLFAVSAIFWTFILVGLTAVGAFIGVAIGIGLLFLIMGFINMVLAAFLWDIDSRLSFWNTLFHGLALFLALIFVSLVFYHAPLLVVPGTTTMVVAFVIESFLSGLIAKKIAEWASKG